MNTNASSTSPMPCVRRYDLIVFDWDGTLFDSTALIVRSIQSACRDLGVRVPEAAGAAYVIGLGLNEALQHAAPGLAPADYPRMVERYRHHYEARRDEVTLFPGVIELLQALRLRGHRLAVATGKSRRGLDDALDRAAPGQPGLRGLFDATRTADETRSKPHPQMLLELMDELDAEPGRTLMIGDTTHDLSLADNAGVDSLAVGYGAHELEAFEAHAPVHVAHSVDDLAAWLQAHG